MNYREAHRETGRMSSRREFEKHYGSTEPQLVMDVSSAFGRHELKAVRHYLMYHSTDIPVRINVERGRDPKFRFEVGDRVWRHVDVFNQYSPIRTGTVVMLYQRVNTRFGDYREQYMVWWDDGTYHRGLLSHGATPVRGLLPPAEDE